MRRGKRIEDREEPFAYHRRHTTSIFTICRIYADSTDCGVVLSHPFLATVEIPDLEVCTHELSGAARNKLLAGELLSWLQWRL